MNFLVTRHGETDWNLQGRLQGTTDIDLNNTGIAQAYETKRNLDKEKIDLIITSPLKRAKHTAEIINKDRNIPLIEDNRLTEISFGNNEGMSGWDFDYVGFWDIDNPVPIENAETVRNMLKRVKSLLDELKTRNEENILLVAHSGVCRGINVYFNGIPSSRNLLGIKTKNCEVLKYEVKKQCKPNPRKIDDDELEL